MTRIIHRATFRHEGKMLTLSLLRTGDRFVVRAEGARRHLDIPCGSADAAETVYCELLSQGMIGQQLPPIVPNPGAYLSR